METIEDYIKKLEKNMDQKGLNKEKLLEFKVQLEAEFEDYVKDFNEEKDKSLVEKQFINNLESPDELADNLGSKKSSRFEVFSKIFDKYFLLYWLLIEGFLISVYSSNLLEYQNVNSLSSALFLISKIGYIIYVIFWIFPIYALFRKYANKFESTNTINVIDVFKDSIIVYGVLITTFMIYALMIGPTQAYYVGGYEGEIIVWSFIALIYVINKRKPQYDSLLKRNSKKAHSF